MYKYKNKHIQYICTFIKPAARKKCTGKPLKAIIRTTQEKNKQN